MGTNPNVSDPFFAYGIFRRGEIAFPRIAPYVDTVVEGAVEGTLEERDGVHLGRRDSVHWRGSSPAGVGVLIPGRRGGRGRAHHSKREGVPLRALDRVALPPRGSRR
jgi:hypothetical protein